MSTHSAKAPDPRALSVRDASEAELLQLAAAGSSAAKRELDQRHEAEKRGLQVQLDGLRAELGRRAAVAEAQAAHEEVEEVRRATIELDRKTNELAVLRTDYLSQQGLRNREAQAEAARAEVARLESAVGRLDGSSAPEHVLIREGLQALLDVARSDAESSETARREWLATIRQRAATRAALDFLGAE